MFALLEERGARIEPFARVVEAAPPDTDLGLLQALLRGEARSRRAPSGDGTVLVVRGDTSTELAELTASFLARQRESALVVRLTDVEPLESALARRDLPQQGNTRPSGWRPAMQVLPLAIELAFEPRNPHRVLELLTLSVGPFRGPLGRRLARAVSRQPGIGGQEWLRQRALAEAQVEEREARRLREEAGRPEAEAGAEARGDASAARGVGAEAKDAAEAKVAAAARAHAEERMRRLAEWLEAPGLPAPGAPREEVLAVAERVRDWQQRRMGLPQAERYRAAYGDARALCEALLGDTRATLTQEDARQILDGLARAVDDHDLSSEQAGRVAHVAHPSSILASARTVVVWGAVAGTERRLPMSPWSLEEREALARANVVVRDPSDLLRDEAQAWRSVVLSARERVVFVVPATLHGEATAPHPLLDEIAARLGLDPTNDAVITRRAADVLAGKVGGLADVATLPALGLPEARAVWRVAPPLLAAEEGAKGAAATSLEKLASCPLAWVLEQRARLRSGAITKVASGPLLNGNLSHRLVEELHRDGAFERSTDACFARAGELLDRLFVTEGATLHIPGAANERAQLRAQILRGIRALHRYLTAAGFRIAGVEEAIEVASASGRLQGRLDLRLEGAGGEPAVLDLKWGRSSYSRLLEEGRAVQLAVYARAIAGDAEGELPPAGYFALATGKPLSTDERMVSRPIDGPSIDETWERVEATVRAVAERHGAGEVHVLGNTRRSLPLLEALGIPEAKRDGYYAPDRDHACKYCAFDGICGKAWEDVA